MNQLNRRLKVLSSNVYVHNLIQQMNIVYIFIVWQINFDVYIWIYSSPDGVAEARHEDLKFSSVK